MRSFSGLFYFIFSPKSLLGIFFPLLSVCRDHLVHQLCLDAEKFLTLLASYILISCSAWARTVPILPPTLRLSANRMILLPIQDIFLSPHLQILNILPLSSEGTSVICHLIVCLTLRDLLTTNKKKLLKWEAMMIYPFSPPQEPGLEKALEGLRWWHSG